MSGRSSAAETLSSPAALVSGASPAIQEDDLGAASRRLTTLRWVAGLAVALVVALVAAIGIGAVTIPPAVVTAIIGHRHAAERPEDSRSRAG